MFKCKDCWILIATFLIIVNHYLELPEKKTKEEVDDYLDSNLASEKGKKKRKRKKGPLLPCPHCDRKFSAQSIFQVRIKGGGGSDTF